MTKELNLMRRAHAGAAARARAAARVLRTLHACELVLPRSTTLSSMALAIYFNAGYDACERYASAAEFEQSLAEDLDGAWPDRRIVNGVDCYVVRPFLDRDCSSYLRHLGLGYLAGGRLSDADLLDVPMPSLVSSEPSGLTAEEMGVLRAHHRRAALRCVNLLRNLRTALYYVTTALGKEVPALTAKGGCTLDARVAGLVAELEAVADMPFEPQPLRHFGTEADKVNTLRVLPDGEAALEPLLKWV